MSRFSVTYGIRASDPADARARAEAIALEQTVEVPRAVVPEGHIADEIVGRIEEIGSAGAGVYHATISYAPDSAGDEITQFLNVIFGNSSIQQGIRVIAIDPGDEMARRFPGPRFGIAGLRRLTGRRSGGMISPVLKPMGLSPGAFAELAAGCVRGGADIVKEDHGLAGQPTAPFRPRVEAVAEAVRKANAAEGRSALYFPNLSGRVDEISENLRFAKQAGAGGILVMPGLYGFGVVDRIARDAEFDLPVMTHPAFLGPYVLAADTGIAHGVMFGTIQRLAGADISVFPNVGGRFGFSAGECHEIADHCRDAGGPGRPILPSPGGGMSVDRAADMVRMYGPDVVYLLGGSLLADPPRIDRAVAAMRRAVDAADAAGA
ncbi:ribulose-bisphosphate carboxylase large chain [Paracoccus isoporae]|uniref:Ribulose-bisphosphate carboxylase large chain n=1 Tax=Paracoccus isoporae TaxID=591205 RepID=A0A1G7DNN5_9RHOB|nr:RuBisCO large subunit C-terminal-like domain-containing protein [Paracoccus isoporae]SDE52756.1 ribulose-bisphosphate carboxylase large chain [Paracoccus isoporae]